MSLASRQVENSIWTIDSILASATSHACEARRARGASLAALRRRGSAGDLHRACAREQPDLLKLAGAGTLLSALLPRMSRRAVASVVRNQPQRRRPPSLWPALAKMVKQYFAAPASSAGVERVFSAAGKMHGDLQKSAKDSNLLNARALRCSPPTTRTETMALSVAAEVAY